VLALFLVGPGLRAECLLLCAKTEQPAARSTCHDQPADGAAIGAHHDCATIAPAVISAIKRAGSASPASLLTGSQPPLVIVPAARPDRLLHGPPRSAPLIPQSIPLRL
jgi:hypothetical protein